METKTFKSDVVAFFKKMQADKQALNACIRKGENVSIEAQKRGITLATPIWFSESRRCHLLLRDGQRLEV